jgi:hypothetical protein
VYPYGSSFVRPPLVVSVVAGPEGAKNLAGKSPPPDSESVENIESETNLVYMSRKNHRARIADFNSKNAVNFSSARTTRGFPSPRCASTIQIYSRSGDAVIRVYDEAGNVSETNQHEGLEQP